VRRAFLILILVSLALAMLATAVPLAAGDEGPSTDTVRFTNDVAGSSSGVFATEEFNTRDSNGQLKRLRHSKVTFPDGTILGQYGVEVCTASDSDFSSKGLSACPGSSKLGTGNATVTTTGTPVEMPPIALDVTAFNMPGKMMMVFSSNGQYVSQQPLYAHGTVQEADVKPQCVVPSESDPCPHGEFEPKSLTLNIPAHSRVINGQVFTAVTTPPTCTSAGWEISDVHTFSDGTQDPFVNHQSCRGPSAAGASKSTGALKLAVRPKSARKGRRAADGAGLTGAPPA
jgi:hypothetical protein